jgi:hypothetical protein
VEIDILEYVGENQILFLLLYTQDSHGNTINTKKQGLKILKKDIISMLWIGLKIK